MLFMANACILTYILMSHKRCMIPGAWSINGCGTLTKAQMSYSRAAGNIHVHV